MHGDVEGLVLSPSPRSAVIGVVASAVDDGGLCLLDAWSLLWAWSRVGIFVGSVASDRSMEGPFGRLSPDREYCRAMTKASSLTCAGRATASGTSGRSLVTRDERGPSSTSMKCQPDGEGNVC